VPERSEHASSATAAGLREHWEREHGEWNEEWTEFARLDPDFFVRYLALAEHPWRHGELEPKVKALVQLSVDAAATHLHAAGVRHHIRRALALGASAAEVIEVLELTATMGIHACNVGVPILLEELDAAGAGLERGPLSDRQEEIKAAFTARRGYWNEFWDGILHLDAEFFAAYTELSSWSWEHGALEPRVKELIYTAFDCSATHMFEPGLRQHIRNALAYGASAAEIMEVFELASGIGAKSFALGAPALAAELGG
jgi:alkylhydroperoxidase/carboxymuconolactone decarboxylase family protein YurZ